MKQLSRIHYNSVVFQVVKITETAVGCHVVISSPLYNVPITTVFDGYVDSVPGMQFALQTAEANVAKLFNISEIGHYRTRDTIRPICK